MTAAQTLWRFTPLLIVALVWEATTRLGLISAYALPPLTQVVQSFFAILGDGLAYNTGRSLLRGAVAFLGAVGIGVPLGVLMAWYRTVRLTVNAPLRCLYPMPKSALIPLTIMWIGLGDGSKIALIFIGCLLPIVLSSFNAARGVDRVLLWTARGMGATEGEVLREVVVPAALPEILNGIRTALALAFILMVSGELVIANNGIGYLIDLLGEGGNYAGMFAGVVTISAIGFLADRGYVMLVGRLLAWRE